jgi:F0F1-type ATP synthase assembly protein I
MPQGAPWQRMLKYASAGTEFIGIFASFLLGGLLLDWRIHTMPVFTLLGALLGFGLGLYRLVKEAKAAQRDFERKNPPGGRR